MYDYLLFDLDGTVTDSGPGITNAVRFALKEQNISPEDPSVLYRFIGPPLWDSFALYFQLTGEENKRAVADFRRYYNAGGKYENAVYTGMEEVLRTASESGKTLVLCTSKPEAPAIDILRHFGLDRYFTLFSGGVDGIRSEKDEVIAYALELIEHHAGVPVDRSRILMIGDREFDILGARTHGLDSVGVLFGFGSREELTAAGATYLVETPMDLLSVF